MHQSPAELVAAADRPDRTGPPSGSEHHRTLRGDPCGPDRPDRLGPAWRLCGLSPAGQSLRPDRPSSSELETSLAGFARFCGHHPRELSLDETWLSTSEFHASVQVHPPRVHLRTC